MNNSLFSDTSRMIGQMLIVGFQGSTADEAVSIIEAIYKYNLGGVILYDQFVSASPPTPHNIRNPEQVKSLNRALQYACDGLLLIGVDQEGGQVHRLHHNYGFPPTQSWGKLGEKPDLKQTYNHSKKMALTLREAGFNLNFAPVLDIPADGKSFINQKDRCFSNNPQLVSAHACEFVRAHRESGVLTAGKHFPGQGSAGGDTHDGFVDVTHTWSEHELLPYKELIEENFLDAVMTSHLFNQNLDPDLPATLSKNILNDLLRNELGFKGVIISDDPQMKAITKHFDLKTAIKHMLQAGVDLFCFGNNLFYDEHLIKKVVTAISELVSNGDVSIERIHQSFERIQIFKNTIL